jgi:hypothetical protein
MPSATLVASVKASVKAADASAVSSPPTCPMSMTAVVIEASSGAVSGTGRVCWVVIDAASGWLWAGWRSWSLASWSSW